MILSIALNFSFCKRSSTYESLARWMTSQVISTGATDKNDKRASFSNFGDCVDLFAPGTGIESAQFNEQSDFGITTKSGTSMACPHTTGECAVRLFAFLRL